jgi:hypothetical protein
VVPLGGGSFKTWRRWRRQQFFLKMDLACSFSTVDSERKQASPYLHPALSPFSSSELLPVTWHSLVVERATRCKHLQVRKRRQQRRRQQLRRQQRRRQALLLQIDRKIEGEKVSVKGRARRGERLVCVCDGETRRDETRERERERLDERGT